MTGLCTSRGGATGTNTSSCLEQVGEWEFREGFLKMERTDRETKTEASQELNPAQEYTQPRALTMAGVQKPRAGKKFYCFFEADDTHGSNSPTVTEVGMVRLCLGTLDACSLLVCGWPAQNTPDVGVHSESLGR